MDSTSAAVSLKMLLVAHDNAGSQISTLGKFFFMMFFFFLLCVTFDIA